MLRRAPPSRSDPSGGNRAGERCRARMSRCRRVVVRARRFAAGADRTVGSITPRRPPGARCPARRARRSQLRRSAHLDRRRACGLARGTSSRPTRTRCQAGRVVAERREAARPLSYAGARTCAVRLDRRRARLRRVTGSAISSGPAARASLGVFSSSGVHARRRAAREGAPSHRRAARFHGWCDVEREAR